MTLFLTAGILKSPSETGWADLFRRFLDGTWTEQDTATFQLIVRPEERPILDRVKSRELTSVDREYLQALIRNEELRLHKE